MKEYFKNNTTKPIPPPPYNVPSLSSVNFPSYTNESGLFSHIYCNNILTTNDFIQNNNKDFGSSIKVYKTLTQNNENDCLTQCKNDKYCSSYVFTKNNNKDNCKLYNVVPTNLNNNSIVNSGYKYKYKYNFNNLNDGQKNNVKSDCINTYLNQQYNTDNKKYSSCITYDNDKINFNSSCLYYSVFDGKRKTVNLSKYENNDIINSIGDNTINDFVKEYNYYLQTQTNLLQTDNENRNEKEDNEERRKAEIRFKETEKYVKDVQKYNNDLLTEQIKDNVQTNLTRLVETFENKNDDINKKQKYLLIFFIILIFAFIIYKNI